MRLMGIDYGAKRVGIALTNEDGTMAFPHTTLVHDETLAERVAALCMQERVGKVVVGQSHDLAGKPNPIEAQIVPFIEALRAHTGLLVVAEPEQYSTQAALRTQGRTKQTDASAAALILDSYLTRENHSS